MADNKPYNHADIRRYLQQQMPPEEMHAFEKAMMDDLMLSDAVDGFGATDWQQTEEHLIEIENKIKQDKREAELIPFSTKQISWWRVAAIVLVIATGGVLSYSLLRQPTINKGQGTQLSINEVQKPIIENDTIKEKEKPFANAVTEPIEKNTLRNSPEVSSSLDAKNTEAPIASINVDDSKSEAYNVPSPHPNLQKQVTSAPQNTAAGGISGNSETYNMAKVPVQQTKELKGKVVTATGEPLAGASVKIDDKNIATATDNNGNFTLKSADTVVKVDVNSVGYATANTRLNRNDADNKIVLKENSQNLSEVVVSTYGARRKTKLSYSTAKASANDLKTAAQPTNGMTSYMQYIKKQADSTLLADGKKPANINVLVEFSINKKGKPTQLKATGTAEKYYRMKAIYIVENGPLWMQSEGSKRKINVSF